MVPLAGSTSQLRDRKTVLAGGLHSRNLLPDLCDHRSASSCRLAGAILPGDDVVERLADQLDLTPDERAALLPSGKQTLFANRVHWAKAYLSKAGMIEFTPLSDASLRKSSNN